ncbi:serine/threonine-protein kinase SBK1-like [Protopterus annectens]|uniref:serine/threonine-protein kinase SBK1-like n=1 Tax=Protopterus annectens TaxID=7888 RepID=UPI001CFA3E16|nr:serine/threonine-protein kinase SBK1-like [Protopterus annectens]
MNLNKDAMAKGFLEDLLELTSQNLPLMELKEHYKFVKELGRGSYGRVLLVTHRLRGTPMALKLMPKNKTKLHSFLQEYCISLCLSSHPGFVNAFGIIFETKCQYGFAQETAVAKDLFSILEPGVGIPEAAAKRCAVQVANALEFMHSKGLVHRDIKPDNVLLYDRDCHQVKLTDFGLTCLRGTAVKPLSGTLPYTAPEMCQLSTSESLSAEPSLDIWAFGVLLFCLVTGFFPWDRCIYTDPNFKLFCSWQKRGITFDIPSLWMKPSVNSLPLFRNLLMINPLQRSPAGEIHHFLRVQWKLNTVKQYTRVDNANFLQKSENKNKLLFLNDNLQTPDASSTSIQEVPCVFSHAIEKNSKWTH